MNLAKAYTPNDYEPNIYALWEQSGVFASTGKGEPYCVVMPPPNANGNLHIGHALGTAIQDSLVRYHRMKGFDAVYIPGADHAGFETWVVYEKELESLGKSRFEYSRDQLYSQVWDFVDAHRGNVELQLRALGAGVSWSDLVFTLDAKVINTVYDTFKRLWDDGLVYRGEKIVSYCTKHHTSFADIEVLHKEEKSKLWKIAYPTLDKIGEIIVATTRPETMLGDVAVAVHTDDERYKQLIGTKVLLPILNKEIPVIADSYVDPAYGTGVVKITPAHDPNDFEIAQRHELPALQVIGFDGKMENVPGQYLGKTPVEARKIVLAALEAEELRRGEEEIVHSVAHCYKCGTVIEPLLKEQWFLKMEGLAARAIEAIEQGDVSFTPANKGAVVVNYLKQLRDWSLSRQIPWGIPIPAFQSKTNPDDWIFDERVDEKEIVVNGTTYVREEDTFDTWFSSGQWPFITTDYLNGGELAKFYPNAVMETAGDILFAWVARMIMLGLYVTDKVPFTHVYLHGLVLDEHGVKMSKSKGNVINPMDIVSEYGSDALRFGIMSARSAAQPQAFSVGKVVAGRNLCNKLWNIARFLEAQIGEMTPAPIPEPVSLADHWIVHRLNIANHKLQFQLSEYRFAEAAETIYHLIWDDVADWYVEVSKVEHHTNMSAYVLDTMLRLAHPFLPFVTETIWQSLAWHDDILAGQSWPSDGPCDELSAAEFGRLRRLVNEIRYVTSELPGNDKYTVLYGDDSLVADNKDLIQRLAKLQAVDHTDTPRGLRLAASGRDAWLDIDAETLYEHQSNLERRLADTEREVAVLEGRLANENYISKAPENLVEETRQALVSKQALVARLQEELRIISTAS